MTFEEFLTDLTKHCGVLLSINEGRLYYEEVPKDGVYDLQWYPDTPVGFYRVTDATIEGLIKKYLEVENDS